jgi:branched-chain amino acid aminotransferase
MGLESKQIWINGEFVDYDKATVHFMTPTMHYGIGAFEGIRCYNTDNGPAVFRLTEHIVRLVNTAKVLGYNELPYSVEEMVAATKKTISLNGFKECYIRPLLYLTGDTLGLDLDNYQPNIGIAAWEWGSYLGEEALKNGITANVSSFTRHHINVTMTKAKITGNYINSVLAKTDSLRGGYGEAIMLDPQGFVAECSGENLFVVRNEQIITPPTATILEGITRDALLTLANDLGVTVSEEQISRDQLYIADEVFVCGTAAECIAVREIDHRTIGSGKMGPITASIQRAFHDAIRGRHARSSEWLEYVNA